MKDQDDQKITKSKNTTSSGHLQAITWFLFFTVLSFLALSITFLRNSGGGLTVPDYLSSENLAKGFL